MCAEAYVFPILCMFSVHRSLLYYNYNYKNNFMLSYFALKILHLSDDVVNPLSYLSAVSSAL